MRGALAGLLAFGSAWLTTWLIGNCTPSMSEDIRCLGVYVLTVAAGLAAAAATSAVAAWLLKLRLPLLFAPIGTIAAIGAYGWLVVILELGPPWPMLAISAIVGYGVTELLMKPKTPWWVRIPAGVVLIFPYSVF